MKKYFSLAFLLLSISAYSQYARITYPIDKTVFQQKPNDVTPISLAFQVDMYRFSQDAGVSGGILVYKVEQVDLKTGQSVLSTPRTWASPNTHSNWSLPTLDYKGFLVNNLQLAKGWYKVSLGVYFPTPADFVSTLSTVSFGVGDVYFIAGQSNASGYDDEQEDNVVTNAQTYETTEQYEAVSFIKSPELIGTIAFNYENLNILGLPYNPKPNPNVSSDIVIQKLSNGTLTTKNKIYPNGRDSWYWAQFAYRMAKDKATPVMLFNVATPNTSMYDWASSFNTDRYKQLRRTLQTYGSMLGAKAVLWHQGERDAVDLMFASNQNNYLSDYSSRLSNMIAWSRGDLLQSSDADVLKKLSWYVSKVSYSNAANWTVTNPSTTPSDPFISDLACQSIGRLDLTKKITSTILKNAQQNNPSNNVFLGVANADDISECDRASKLRIHFTGEGTNNGFEKMGNDWYNAINTNYSTSSVESQQLLPIGVSLDVNGNYVLTGPRKAGNVAYAKYFWVKNGDGVYDATKVLSTNRIFSSNQNYTTLPIFYVCYVSDDTDPNTFRLKASQPFVMKNSADLQNSLSITDGSQTISQVSFSSNSNLKTIIVESGNLLWDTSSIPAWVSLSTNSGGFQNTTVNIIAQSNTSNSPRSETFFVKQLGTTADYFQTLTIYQAGNTCSDVNNSSLSPINPSYEWSGFGTMQTNKSIDGNTMKINGRTFINGIGTHANSTVKYNLNGGFQRFTALVGRDDEVASCGVCGTQRQQFIVKLDGNTIYDSGIFSFGVAKIIDVSIANGQILELIVNDGGDGVYGDHVNWADAKLFCTASPCGDYLTLSSPTDDANAASIKRARLNITATNKINVGNNAYKAGNSIILNAGFEAKSGSVFSATIPSNPCN